MLLVDTIDVQTRRFQSWHHAAVDAAPVRDAAPLGLPVAFAQVLLEREVVLLHVRAPLCPQICRGGANSTVDVCDVCGRRPCPQIC